MGDTRQRVEVLYVTDRIVTAGMSLQANPNTLGVGVEGKESSICIPSVSVTTVKTVFQGSRLRMDVIIT